MDDNILAVNENGSDVLQILESSDSGSDSVENPTSKTSCNAGKQNDISNLKALRQAELHLENQSK